MFSQPALRSGYQVNEINGSIVLITLRLPVEEFFLQLTVIDLNRFLGMKLH